IKNPTNEDRERLKKELIAPADQERRKLTREVVEKKVEDLKKEGVFKPLIKKENAAKGTASKEEGEPLDQKEVQPSIIRYPSSTSPANNYGNDALDSNGLEDELAF